MDIDEHLMEQQQRRIPYVRRSERVTVSPTLLTRSFFLAEPGLESLAYLQYMIDRKNVFSHTSFANRLVRHCREHLYKHVTEDEIRNKLMLFWQHWHSPHYNPTDWKLVYRLGIRGLSGLPADISKSLKDRVELLKDCLVGERNRTRQRNVAPLVRIRDVAPGDSPKIVRSKTRKQRRRRKDRIVVRKAASEVEFHRQTLHQQELMPSDQSSTARPINEDEIQDSQEKSLHADALSKIPTPDGLKEVQPGKKGFSDVDEYDLEAIPDEHETSSQKAQFFGGKPRFFGLLQQLAAFIDPTSTVMLDMQDLWTLKAGGAHYWKQRCLKAEKRMVSLKMDNTRLQIDLQESGQSDEIKKIIQLQKENESLRKGWTSYKAVQSFSDPFKDSTCDTNENKAVVNLVALESKLHRVLVGHTILFNLQQLPPAPTDLLQIFQKGLGFDMKSSVTSVLPTSAFCGVQIRLLVLNLISAAICRWVFEADLEFLFREHNLMYTKLRSLLGDQNEDLARSFDFAAYQKCIDDPYMFDEAIPKQAQYLARRLQRCVLPLLYAQEHLDKQYADVVASWRDSESQLIEVFRLALQVKVHLLLTTNVYKCSFFPPSTDFDTENMGMVTSYGKAERQHVSESNLKVSITTFPCIWRYHAMQDEFVCNRFVAMEKEIKVPSDRLWAASVGILG